MIFTCRIYEEEDMHREFGLESRVKNGNLVNVDLDEMSLFVWILQKAGGRSGLH